MIDIRAFYFTDGKLRVPTKPMVACLHKGRF